MLGPLHCNTLINGCISKFRYGIPGSVDHKCIILSEMAVNTQLERPVLSSTWSAHIEQTLFLIKGFLFLFLLSSERLFISDYNICFLCIIKDVTQREIWLLALADNTSIKKLSVGSMCYLDPDQT